jgi:bacterioferritin (cytochrome b1)
MDETNPLTVSEALTAYPENPQAAALALGMVLMQQSSDQVYRISQSIEKQNEERIEELEKELDYWKHLGKKWLRFQALIAPDPEPFE